MSLADHRPRRIIAGTPPPMPQPALDAALAAQQHRFQRVLLAAPPIQRPRPEGRPERPFVEWPLRHLPLPQPKPQPESARGADSPADSARSRSAPHREPPSAAKPAPPGTALLVDSGLRRDDRAVVAPPSPAVASNRPRRAARAIATRPAVAVPELPPHRDLLADPDAWKHAGLAKPAPEDWDVDLAHRITALCQRASPSFQAWSLTVPLDAAVLPDTELHLALSPQRLGLRFQTLSPYSMALVERHRDRLVALLQRTLPGSREIDVELS